MNYSQKKMIAVIMIILIAIVSTLYFFENYQWGEEENIEIKANLNNIHIINSLGENVNNVQLGDTVIFSGLIKNIEDESRKLFLIIEVRNETSHLIDFGANGSEYKPDQEKSIGIGWSAKHKGNYTVVAYVSDDFEGKTRSSTVENLMFEVKS